VENKKLKQVITETKATKGGNKATKGENKKLKQVGKKRNQSN